MGYNTDFSGSFKLNKKLDDETFKLLKGIHDTRRMNRDMSKLYPNMSAKEIAEKFGRNGEFYIDETSEFGQSWDDPSVIDFNCPPPCQPSLWCKWIPTDDRMSIEWDCGEKAYEMDAWIKYLIYAILDPRGYVLNGEVLAQGEDIEDRWKIVIKDNVVVIIRLD